ncbi:MAG: hypothetical protein GTN76_09300, partial [Candidatus Aenigmarchaeota archaeon]|nr:hypothetical protein [Candidatus Aenigmarchaeota archaeon]NIP40265.1 hypothetical protein [Candidatus Aenigmarchaeota archaeon]
MIKNYSVLAIFLIGLVFLSGCVTYQPYFPQDGGQGPPPPTCSKHAEVRCQGDCVFWYDSCGNQEEMKECCPHGCMNGECTDTNPCEQAEGYCQSSIAEALCREGFEESNIS